MLITHHSVHAHRHQPQLFTHSCYILYHSPTFALTSIIHSLNTFNIHLTHNSFIHSFIHSYPQTPANQNHSHHLLTSIRYHLDIDHRSTSISIAYQHNHYTHSSPTHSHNTHSTHTLFTTSHINSYLINDQLIKIITVYISNHNSYLIYLLKATSITSDSTAIRGAKPDLKSTHLRLNLNSAIMIINAQPITSHIKRRRKPQGQYHRAKA